MNLHSAYLAMDLHISVSDVQVIRAARSLFIGSPKRCVQYKPHRKQVYRQFLQYHNTRKQMEMCLLGDLGTLVNNGES